MPSIKSTYNYPQAFSLFAQGHPIQDCAEQCQIPLDTLKEHANRQGWKGLTKSLQSYYSARDQLAVQSPSADTQLILKKLEGNREVNYQQASELRALADKTLKAWTLECSTPTEDGQPRYIHPKSLRDLACALATIHELTYRALGDYEAKRDSTATDRPAAAPSITINLPGVLVNPRGHKTIDIKAQKDVAQDEGSIAITKTLGND